MYVNEGEEGREGEGSGEEGRGCIWYMVTYII
jgi:hypothetical protein